MVGKFSLNGRLNRFSFDVRSILVGWPIDSCWMCWVSSPPPSSSSSPPSNSQRVAMGDEGNAYVEIYDLFNPVGVVETQGDTGGIEEPLADEVAEAVHLGLGVQ